MSNVNFNMKNEYYRKLVHLSSLVYPFTYFFSSKILIVAILLAVFILVAIWDVLRILNKPIQFLSFINSILREKELNKKSFSGASYFLLSCLIVVVFFSKDIAIMSMLVLIISDTMAALIGKNFGKIKIYNKSLEGSLAFFVSGMLVLLLYALLINMPLTLIFFLMLILIMLVTTIVEFFSNQIHIDDNFSITLVSALMMKFMLF